MSRDRGISRQAITQGPALWPIVGVLYGLFAVATALAPVFYQVDDGALVWASAVLMASVAMFAFATGPPAAGSVRPHAVLVATSALPVLASFGLGRLGPVAFGALLYCAPLAAVWNVDRRHIIAHLGIATAVSGMSLPFATWSMVVAWLCTVPSMWTLAICCVVALEAAEAQRAHLTELSYRDPLTDLCNRRGLTRAALMCLASGDQVALIAIDLDGFKSINDEVGHDAGDEILIQVADTLRRSVGPENTVARPGGDEFCVLVPGATLARAEVVAELIRQRLKSIETPLGALTAGVGVSTSPADGQTLQGLQEVADRRLRDQKASSGTQRRRNSPSTSSPARAATTLPELLIGGRVNLARWRPLWLATGAVFAAYSLGGFGLLLVAPGLLERPTAIATMTAGALVAIAIAASAPPAPGSIRVHAVQGAAYVLPILALISTTPLDAALLPMAIWIGPLVALRSLSRKAAFAHWAIATSIYAWAAVSGAVSTYSAPGAMVAVVTFWSLGYACLLVFEATEQQGRTIRELVLQDPLTGLGNRRQLEHLLHNESFAVGAVLALDLDGFKALNDTVGHGAGDQLLICVARTLRELCGGDGQALRLGGDEFVLVVTNPDPAVATVLQRRARAEISQLTSAGISVGTGIGVACSPADGADLRALLHIADQRLLADKASRRALRLVNE